MLESEGPGKESPHRAEDETFTLCGFDVGSAATKCTVARVCRVPGGHRVCTVLFEEEVSVFVAEDLAASGTNRLSDTVLAQCEAELRRMQGLGRDLGATRFAGVATAAFRNASNGDTWIKATSQTLGIRLCVIPQQEEGRLGYLTAVQGYAGLQTVSSDAPAHIVSWDSGGGSFQLCAREEGCSLTTFEGLMGSAVALGEVRKQQSPLQPHLHPQLSPNPVTAQVARDTVAQLVARLSAEVKDQAQARRIRAFAAQPRAVVVSFGGTLSVFHMLCQLGNLGPHAWSVSSAQQVLYERLVNRSDTDLEAMGVAEPHLAVAKTCLVLAVARVFGLEREGCAVAFVPTTGSILGLMSDASYWSV